MNNFWALPTTEAAIEAKQLISQLGVIRSDNLEYIPFDSVTIATVQLECKQYSSVEDYVRTLNEIVYDAVNRRAHIVCFPAFTGWLSMPFSPYFDSLFPELKSQLLANKVNLQAISDIVSACSPVMMETYITTMLELSRAYGVYIMTGSSLYYENRQCFHNSFLIEPSGTIAGIQEKMLLSPLEQSFGVEPASEVKAFETPIGTFSILITNDIDTYEPAHISKKMGVKILLNPNIAIKPETPMDMADGMNLRVLEQGLYGVQPTMVGDSGLGFTFTKPSRVYSAVDTIYSDSTDCIFAKTYRKDEQDILVTKLNTDIVAKREIPYKNNPNSFYMEEYLKYIY